MISSDTSVNVVVIIAFFGAFLNKIYDKPAFFYIYFFYNFRFADTANLLLSGHVNQKDHNSLKINAS